MEKINDLSKDNINGVIIDTKFIPQYKTYVWNHR